MPLHSFTTSAAALSLGHTRTNRWMWSGWIASGQRQNLPTLFRALALDQVAAACGHWPHQHWLAAARAPDEVIDDQVDALLIPLVLVCLFHVASIPQYRPAYKGRVLSAKAWKRLTARVETRRLAAG